jgi:hypothetical protein
MVMEGGRGVAFSLAQLVHAPISYYSSTLLLGASVQHMNYYETKFLRETNNSTDSRSLPFVLVLLCEREKKGTTLARQMWIHPSKAQLMPRRLLSFRPGPSPLTFGAAMLGRDRSTPWPPSPDSARGERTWRAGKRPIMEAAGWERGDD